MHVELNKLYHSQRENKKRRQKFFPVALNEWNIINTVFKFKNRQYFFQCLIFYYQRNTHASEFTHYRHGRLYVNVFPGHRYCVWYIFFVYMCNLSLSVTSKESTNSFQHRWISVAQKDEFLLPFLCSAWWKKNQN